MRIGGGVPGPEAPGEDFVLGDSVVPDPGEAADTPDTGSQGLRRRRRRSPRAPDPTGLPPLLRVSDRLLRWGPVLLLLFAPLAWGSVEAWSALVVIGGSGALGAVWILRLALFPAECARLREAHSHLRSWSGGLHRPLIAVLAVGAVQLAPLGPLVPAVAPAGAQIQEQAGIPAAERTLSLARGGTRLALAHLGGLALLFFAVLDGTHGRADLRRLAAAILALGFAHAVGGILWHYQGAGSAYGMSGTGGSSFGPYINRNHFACLLGMIVPFGVGYLLSLAHRRTARSGAAGGVPAAPARRPEVGARRFLVGFAVAVMAGAIALSLSRGGIVTTLVALAALAFAVGALRGTRASLWKAAAAIAGAFAFAVWLAARQLVERLGTLLGLFVSDAVAAPRTGIWQDTLRMAADFPLFGTGFGSFAEVYPRYQTAHADGRVLQAHSDWVQLLAEGGLAGTLAALAVLAAFATVTARLLVRRHDREAVFLALGGLGGLLAFLLHGFLDFNAHIPANALWFTVLAAVTLKAAASRATEPA